jgi:hypothetical protein
MDVSKHMHVKDVFDTKIAFYISLLIRIANNKTPSEIKNGKLLKRKKIVVIKITIDFYLAS